MIDNCTEDPVITNARRLLEDARLLLEHGRFASSLGLAVLSFEETGKFVLSLWSAEDPELLRQKGFTYHRLKQAACSALYQAALVQTTVDQFLLSQGYRWVSVGPDHELTWGVEKSGHLFRQSEVITKSFRKEMNEYVSKAIGRDDKSEYVAYSLAGVFERLKQAGFYFDFEWEARNLVPPSITSGDAEGFISRAAQAIEMSQNKILLVVAKEVFKSTLSIDSRADW